MSAARNVVLRTAIALGAAWSCSLAREPEPWPAPVPLARDTPAFQAPAEPPAQDSAQPAPPPPEPAAPLALPDALALALMRNPDLAAFAWDVRASEARTIQAGTVPNPELEFRMYRFPQDPGEDEARRRLILKQPLELGGKRRRRADVARTERNLAGWDYEAKRVEVVTLVSDRFAEVLGAQRRVDTWKSLVDDFDVVERRVTALVGAGSVRSVEVHQLGRQLGLARIELQRAKIDLAAARLRLASTWDNRSPQFTEAVGELEPVATLPDLDTVFGLAQDGPAVARWDAELERSHAELALAKAERVPDLTYGVGIRWEEDVDERDYLVDVQFALPIVDRKQGDIREAKFGLARAENARRAAEAAARELIAEAYYALAESDARRATLAGEVLPGARAAFEAFRLAFESRPDQVGDLLDARRDLARAEADHVDALVDCHQARATLEGLLGRSLIE